MSFQASADRVVTRVPGEQPWIKQSLDGGVGSREDVAEQMQIMNINGASGSRLPDVVRGKWPLPGGEYQGALIKVRSSA